MRQPDRRGEEGGQQERVPGDPERVERREQQVEDERARYSVDHTSVRPTVPRVDERRGEAAAQEGQRRGQPEHGESCEESRCAHEGPDLEEAAAAELREQLEPRQVETAPVLDHVLGHVRSPWIVIGRTACCGRK